jgi:hypothetical protein
MSWVPPPPLWAHSAQLAWLAWLNPRRDRPTRRANASTRATNLSSPFKRSDPSREKDARHEVSDLSPPRTQPIWERESLVKVIIDTDSREDALTLADALPGSPEAGSVRGYGLVRMVCKNKHELHDLFSAVDEAVQRHKLRWARVRYGDDERVFRSSERRAG